MRLPSARLVPPRGTPLENRLPSPRLPEDEKPALGPLDPSTTALQVTALLGFVARLTRATAASQRRAAESRGWGWGGASVQVAAEGPAFAKGSIGAYRVTPDALSRHARLELIAHGRGHSPTNPKTHSIKL